MGLKKVELSMKPTKKSKLTKTTSLGIKVSDKTRRKYGACEHNQVSYKSLEHLTKLTFKRLTRDGKTLQKIGTLIEDIKFKKSIIDYQKHIIKGMTAKYEEQFDKYIEANNELKEENTDLILELQKFKAKLYGKFSVKTWRKSNRPNKKEDN